RTGGPKRLDRELRAGWLARCHVRARIITSARGRRPDAASRPAARADRPDCRPRAAAVALGDRFGSGERAARPADAAGGCPVSTECGLGLGPVRGAASTE